MTGWLVVLIFFLWVSGGIGWVNSYELAEEREMSGISRAFVMVLWPLFGLVSAAGQVWAGLRSLLGGGE
jgi:hypothetical protein